MKPKQEKRKTYVSEMHMAVITTDQGEVGGWGGGINLNTKYLVFNLITNMNIF